MHRSINKNVINGPTSYVMASSLTQDDLFIPKTLSTYTMNVLAIGDYKDEQDKALLIKKEIHSCEDQGWGERPQCPRR